MGIDGELDRQLNLSVQEDYRFVWIAEQMKRGRR
jgi:hypothetical protein